jgi:hypothetical protein
MRRKQITTTFLIRSHSPSYSSLRLTHDCEAVLDIYNWTLSLRLSYEMVKIDTLVLTLLPFLSN